MYVEIQQESIPNPISDSLGLASLQYSAAVASPEAVVGLRGSLATHRTSRRSTEALSAGSGVSKVLWALGGSFGMLECKVIM